ERRERAARSYRELALEPNPLYRKYGYFAGVDLAGIDPRSRGPPVPVSPPDPNTLQVIHDASGTRTHLPEALRSAGVTLATLPEAWRPGGAGPSGFLRGIEDPKDRLTALALATFNRGYRLEIPSDCPKAVSVQEITVLSRPDEALSVRRSIRAGSGAHLLLSEELYSTGGAPPARQNLFASTTDLEVGARARVAQLTLHAPGLRTVSIYDRHATVGPKARLAWVWAGFGGFRTRARNRTFLEGNGSDVSDLQTFYGAGEQAYDSAVDITHIGTDTHGQSITRGVFRDQARGMSRGLVRIEKEARRTISYLSEHAMLLSRGARSDTIPILEILCRDVKATHSSSVAPVDPEKVFYLESRGLPRDEAVRMIGEGFLSHVLERSPIGGLRELAYPFLSARWDGRPIEWREGAYPTLPKLELLGTEAEPDWRFDQKLR
ncbi:MAG TPA: SufD family Fe-S cluster assembly protein, partial [Thermoplasmata archaeon]|nr:SufD family Fe-S cluster assembly protein [Thermoplasmata archaeon]